MKHKLEEGNYHPTPGCEFCAARPGIAILHAENYVVSTFSVQVCAGCFGELLHGRSIPDIFGWLWRITLDGVVVAEMTTTLAQSYHYRADVPKKFCDWWIELRDPPTQTQVRDDKTRNLVRDLARAAQDHHLGMETTRPFTETHGRDEALIFRARNWLGEDTEEGVPDE